MGASGEPVTGGLGSALFEISDLGFLPFGCCEVKCQVGELGVFVLDLAPLPVVNTPHGCIVISCV